MCPLTDKTDTNSSEAIFFHEVPLGVKVFEEGPGSSHPLAKDIILEMAEPCLQTGIASKQMSP